MSLSTSTVEIPFRSFQEKAGVTLAQDTLVKIVVDSGAIVVAAATAGVAHGVMVGRMPGSTKTVKVHLFAPTVRLVQNAAVTCGADVMQDPAAATKVITATAGGFVKGTKIGPYHATGGAQNDVIEVILDGHGGGTAAAGFIPQTGVAHGNANGAIAAVNSTAVNPTKTDFDALLAAAETLADDVRSMQAALIAAGIYTAS